jgi:hypothetical protein
MSDRALKQAILFFGIVSFFLGKKALEGAADAADETAAFRRANQRAA